MQTSGISDVASIIRMQCQEPSTDSDTIIMAIAALYREDGTMPNPYLGEAIHFVNLLHNILAHVAHSHLGLFTILGHLLHKLLAAILESSSRNSLFSFQTFFSVSSSKLCMHQKPVWQHMPDLQEAIIPSSNCVMYRCGKKETKQS